MTDILHTTISPCENERRIFNQSLSAIQHGFRVKIVALKTPDVRQNEIYKNILIERIKIKSWKGGKKKFLVFNFKLFWKLIKLEFKILHVHDLWVLPASAIANFFKRKKLIYDAHEYYRGLEIFSQKPFSGKFWALIEGIFIRSADRIITINSFHSDLYQKTYRNLPGIDIILNLPRKEKLPDQKGLSQFSQRNSVILYQGILKKGRGLEKIVTLFKDMTIGSLELVGYGDSEDDLRALVEKFNLQNRVIFKGKVSWEKLLDETRRARCGLVLFEPTSINYTYALPNKFFEYVMMGTPVIASKIPTFEKLVSDFKVGLLVNPNSGFEIKQAVEDLLNDEEKWNNCYHNCLKAREVWNWESQEEKFIKIYITLFESDKFKVSSQ
jgi:glycosyltransferase involved in cell wall biosynthesis